MPPCSGEVEAEAATMSAPWLGLGDLNFWAALEQPASVEVWVAV